MQDKRTYASRDSEAIERDLLVKDTREEWCHRIQPEAFFDHPLDVRHVRQVLLSHTLASALLENSIYFFQHLLLTLWIPCQQIESPLCCVRCLSG